MPILEFKSVVSVYQKVDDVKTITEAKSKREIFSYRLQNADRNYQRTRHIHTILLEITSIPDILKMVEPNFDYCKKMNETHGCINNRTFPKECSFIDEHGECFLKERMFRKIFDGWNNNGKIACQV